MTEYTFPSATTAIDAFAEASRVDNTLVPDAVSYNNGGILLTPNIAYVVYNGRLFYDLSTFPQTEENRAIREAIKDFLIRHKMKQKQREIASRKLKIMQRIVDAINAATTPQRRAVLEEGNIKIDDQVCSDFHLNEDRTHVSPWRSPLSGKISIVVVDQYGRSLGRVPQRRDGSHDYARVAGWLLQRADQHRLAWQQELTRRTNKDAITSEFLEQIKPLTRVNLSASSVEGKPVRVRFVIDQAMTVDQVRQLAEALHASGLFE